jgi:type IX secretion system PorP/SprF family membrane protein
MNYIKKILIIIFSITGIWAYSQDSEFSQVYSNPLVLNPAFTGSAGCSRLAFGLRSQWPELSGGYNTSSISYDQYSNKLRGGLGILYMYDVAGNALFTNSVNVFYAYNIKCSENLNVRPAVNIGVYRKSLDGSHFNPPLSTSANMYFNVGAGAIVIYKKLSAGFSLDHINQPDEGFFSVSRLPSKLTVHASWQGKIAEKLNMTPMVIFQKQQDFEQILPCLLFNYSYVKFGAGFRTGIANSDSFIMMVGFQNNKLSIGYSYDYTISKLTNATGGSHEISAVFKFNCKDIADRQLIPAINNF